MRPFLSRILICVVPCLIAAAIVGIATSNFVAGNTSGLTFKPGVDLAGGTILVYEVDVDKFPDGKVPENFKIEDMVTALKRRIDPGDLKTVTIRSVGKYRVEIILPAGNFTPAEVEEIKNLISKVGSLEFRILANQKDDDAAIKAAEDWFKDLGNPAKKDDPAVKEKLAELQRRAQKGLPPPAPLNAEGKDLFPWKTDNGEGKTSYSWVELGRMERESMGLNNAAGDAAKQGKASPGLWLQAEEARRRNEPLRVPNMGGVLLYSRDHVYQPASELERKTVKDKKVDYFVLVRDPQPGKTIDGRYLINAGRGEHQAQLAVEFQFNTAGGNLFSEVTSDNRPSGSGQGAFRRHLAIILDGMIESAPTINSTIGSRGVITGKFTPEQVDRYVRVFKAGALPASLKGQPVSENTMGATLGADTIRAGATSVLIAFVAILLFMLVYYRFAGLVACTSLLANLLLTLGFMVLVQASFTLPGLAGLVLMLGMAVDANVLIYERFREERDRGASLALAIRNGYDRAFPTIIDTHLSSIFTAIVLYAVGNDQLKGFGISLTAGLIISLFTSLYMTRLMFDVWLAKGWLHKLSMFRLLTNPGIDFMRIRYYWFAATIILTLFGITVFLVRGPAGLNIDFVGGTAYSGQLVKPMDIAQLRNKLDEARQKTVLKVDKVEELSDPGGEGIHYKITYDEAVGGAKAEDIRLRNKAPGATKEAREKVVADMAATLPDLSVEQIFPENRVGRGDKSEFFTVRTSEKEPELVLVSIDRLLRDDGESLLKKVDMTDPLVQTKDGAWADLFKLDPKAELKEQPVRSAVLTFNDLASPGHVANLLRQQFQQLPDEAVRNEPQPFDLTGVKQDPDDPDLRKLVAEVTGGDANKRVESEGRYRLMRLTLTDNVAGKVSAAQLAEVLRNTQKGFDARPQPERLENFDSQFAAETQTRAIYAILLSWLAILGYLWFRFGNWTFGLAAVACLIHDLFFTLGIIAFSHYIHHWMPGLATALGLHDFKIDLPSVAALLTLIGYSVNDTIVVFDRIREVRGKNPELTSQMINDSVNQTLSRTLLTAFSVWLVVIVLYIWGGEGVHLFAFVMVVGVIVGTYSSIYIASPLLLIFGEGTKPAQVRERKPEPAPEGANA